MHTNQTINNLAFVTRKAEQKDVADIVRIQRDAVEKEWHPFINDFQRFLSEKFDHNIQLQKYQERIEDSNRLIVVVEIDHHIVGFGATRNAEDTDQPPGYDAQLSGFYLDPNYQRQGAGTLLFNVLFNKLRDRGIKSIAAWCIQDNQSARQFYEKNNGVLLENILTPDDYKITPHVVYGWQL